MSSITDLDIVKELYRICGHYMQLSERSIDAINNVAEELANKDKLLMDDIEVISKIRYINCTVDYAVLKPELIEKLNKKLSDHFPEGYYDPFDERSDFVTNINIQ